jgi:hypothetical protein
VSASRAEESWNFRPREEELNKEITALKKELKEATDALEELLAGEDL